MAITVFTKISATPHALKYRIEADSSGGAQAVARTTILTDCMAGPLKSFLTALTAAQWLAIFSVNGVSDKLSVHAVAVSVGALFTGPAPAIGFRHTSVDVMDIVFPNSTDGAAGIVTLRFQHTISR